MASERTGSNSRSGRSATSRSTAGGRRLAGLCLLAVALTLASCQWRRLTVNDPIDPAAIAFIQSGRTTFTEVVAKLGPPDDIAAAGNTMVVRYRFRDGKYFKIDAGRLLAFWSPVTPEMSMARGQMETDIFQVVLNSNGIVEEYAFALLSPSTRFNPWPF
jgi:hypothetical protein